MVTEGLESSVDKKDTQEKEEAENEESDSETSDNKGIKTEPDLPPSELERLKVFTHRVARCAARSFCETYVRPLVIKNPNPLPSQSETINIMSQNQKDLLTTIVNPTENNEEDETTLISSPKQEFNEEQATLIQKREIEKTSDRQPAIVNPNKQEHSLASTINLMKEKQMISVDKEKPSLSFDIANILSYLPCQSLAASCDRKYEALGEVSNSESKQFEIIGHSDTKKSSKEDCRQSETDGKEDYEEASPFTDA